MAGVLIGLSDLFVAELKEDGEYGVPFRVAKGIEATVANNVSTTELYADDGVSDTDTSEGATEITIGVRSLTSQMLGKLLGKRVDNAGGVVDGSTDIAPYYAFGFRSLKNNGKYRYVWFYKGKFQKPDEDYQTKGESVEYNTPSIVANFIDRTFEGIDGSIRRYTLDEDDEGVDASKVEGWFEEVYVPDFKEEEEGGEEPEGGEE